MQAKSAQAKGDRFEKYLLERLRQEVDANTHRTPGSGNGKDKADLRIPSLNIEIEAKNQKTINIKEWWQQTENQKTAGNMEVLAIRHPDRPEFQKTLIVMDLEDWLTLLTAQKDEVEVVQKFDPKDKWIIANAREALHKVLKLIGE